MSDMGGSYVANSKKAELSSYCVFATILYSERAELFLEIVKGVTMQSSLSHQWMRVEYPGEKNCRDGRTLVGLWRLTSDVDRETE